jgi:hypothetical protein
MQVTSVTDPVVDSIIITRVSELTYMLYFASAGNRTPTYMSYNRKKSDTSQILNLVFGTEYAGCIRVNIVSQQINLYIQTVRILGCVESVYLLCLPLQIL